MYPYCLTRAWPQQVVAKPSSNFSPSHFRPWYSLSFAIAYSNYFLLSSLPFLLLHSGLPDLFFSGHSFTAPFFPMLFWSPQILPASEFEWYQTTEVWKQRTWWGCFSLFLLHPSSVARHYTTSAGGAMEHGTGESGSSEFRWPGFECHHYPQVS